MKKNQFDKLIESIRRKASKRGGWVLNDDINDLLGDDMVDVDLIDMVMTVTDEDAQTVQVIMQPLPGRIEITSEPPRARVLVDGDDVADRRRRAQSKIGYLPENGPLYPDMTVADSLYFTADLRGRS